MNGNNHALVGTAGGTLLSIVPLLLTADVVDTVVLAAVGAIVSFTVSLLLRYLLRRFRR